MKWPLAVPFRGRLSIGGGEGDDTYVWNIDDFGDTIDDRGFQFEEIVTANGTLLLPPGYEVSWESLEDYYDDVHSHFRMQIRRIDNHDDKLYSKLYKAITSTCRPRPSGIPPAGSRAIPGRSTARPGPFAAGAPAIVRQRHQCGRGYARARRGHLAHRPYLRAGRRGPDRPLPEQPQQLHPHQEPEQCGRRRGVAAAQ